MVTIIIPCFNSYQWMEKCLSALRNQNDRDFEVIVVDDASTDDSHQALLAVQEQDFFPMQVIRLDENRGPGHARNVGIDHAKGDWIAFCDSDDWYEENFIEKMKGKAEKEQADLVICDNSHDFQDGKSVPCGKLDVFGESPSREELLAFQEPSLCRLLVKRTLFEGVRLPEVYNAEDVAIAPILMNRAERVVLLKEPLYHYYMRGDSISRKPPKSAYMSFLAAFETVEEELLDVYPEECIYKGIEIVLYGATFSAVKAGVESQIIRDFVQEFADRFPEWKNNKYLGKLGIRKRVYLYFVDKKMIAALRLYAMLHRIYTRQ